MTNINNDLLKEAQQVFNMRKSGIHREDIKDIYGDRSGSLYALGALKLPATPNSDVADHYSKFKDIDRTASVKKVSRLTVMFSEPSHDEETLVKELTAEGLTAETITLLTGLPAIDCDTYDDLTDRTLGILMTVGNVQRYSISVHSAAQIDGWYKEDGGWGYKSESLIAGLFNKGIDHYFWHYGSDIDVTDDEEFIKALNDNAYHFSYRGGAKQNRIMVPYNTASWLSDRYGFESITVSAARSIVTLPGKKKSRR